MSDLPSALAGMSAGEVEAFFHEADAEHIVSLAAATSDAQLELLLGDEKVRSVALGSVLARLDEYAVRERLAAVAGTVAFRLALPKKGEETYVLLFEGSTVTVVPPSDDAAVARQAASTDVTIACGMLDFVRLVTGSVNAALLYLGARLLIDGNELLALEVGGVFRVPGSDGVAVDPTALDPEDVAVAIAKVKDAHLHSVMAGGLREVVLTEVFRRLPDYVDAEKAQRHRLAVGFKIGGRPDGQADRYVVTLHEGRATVERVHEAPEGRDSARDATIALDGAQFIKLVTGHLNPVRGVMRGHLKVRGDVRAALTFSGLIDIPGAKSSRQA